MREIRTLRARRRELETEPRTGLNGHAGGNPGYSQASVLTGHRASSRPYQAFRPTNRFSQFQIAKPARFSSPSTVESGSWDQTIVGANEVFQWLYAVEVVR